MTAARISVVRKAVPSLGSAVRRRRIVVTFGASNRATEATGPATSLKYLITALEDEFDFVVLAKRELKLPRTVELTDGFGSIVRYLREVPFDVLYMNSFFDREYTVPLLTCRRFGLIPKRPTLVAPRGELLGNALGIKSGRKRAYIALVRASGLIHDVWLQATSRMEYEELCTSFRWAREKVLAAEVVCRPLHSVPDTWHRHKSIRVSFLSRISEKKNLDFALAVLGKVECPVEFEIFGPVEDPAYWSKCETLIGALPTHITVTYKGSVAPEHVPQVFGGSDLFFLPTKSENFGHVIYEALSCGVPVLISDQTPWRGLEPRSAGWDLPLDDKDAFARVIEAVAGMDDAGRERLRAGALAQAVSYVAVQDAIAENRRMFRQLVDEVEL